MPQYLPSLPSNPPTHHQVQAAQTLAPSKARLPPHKMGSQRSQWRMGPGHTPTVSGYALGARRNSSAHTPQGPVSQAAKSVSVVRICHE